MSEQATPTQEELAVEFMSKKGQAAQTTEAAAATETNTETAEETTEATETSTESSTQTTTEVSTEENTEAVATEATETEEEFSIDDLAGFKKKTEPKPEEGKTEPEPKAELTELEKMTQDPRYQTLLDMYKAGKDPIEEIKKLATTDPATMTPEQLYAEEIKKYDYLSEEKLEEMRENFRELPETEQIEKTHATREKLKAEHAQQLERLKPDNSQQVLLQQKVEKADKEFNTLWEELPGQEYMGLELSPERIATVRKFLGENPGFVAYTPTGDFDVKTMTEFAIFQNYKKDIVGAIANRAKASAKKEVLTARTNPDKKDKATITAAPQFDAKEAALKHIKTQRGDN